MGSNVLSPIGANLTRVDDAAAFDLGARAYTNDGKEYVYASAEGAISGAGYVGVLNAETGEVVELTTTNGASKIGWPVVVAMAAMADEKFGWFQRKGLADVQVLASAAAGVALNSTATSGALDDDATAGARTIVGLSLTTARAASAGTAKAVLNYPVVGATAA